MSMKITRGPVDTSAPAQGTEGTDKAAKPASTFAGKVAETAPAGPAAGTSGADKPAATPPRLTGDIGAKLKTGELTPEAAVDQVVNRILDRQIPANAPAAARSQVETALRDALEGDPVLASKMKSLAD